MRISYASIGPNMQSDYAATRGENGKYTEGKSEARPPAEKTIEYRIISENTEQTLELMVASHIRGGWVPQGGASVAYMPPQDEGRGGFFRYVQAMVRFE